MTETLDQLAVRASEGDRSALEVVVARLQDRLYRLSLRMLGDVDDARDATQEIVLKIVTRLSTYRGESAFVTWALKVATNHLINVKQGRKEQLSYEQFGELIDQGVSWYAAAKPSPLEAAVVEEGKLVCTQAMLTCVDREHRLAFVLGQILELSGEQAAEVLEIEPAAFRKRLSRAREQIEAFAQRKCGLVREENACRCEKQACFGVHLGITDPTRLTFVSHPRTSEGTLAGLNRLKSATEALRGHPEYAAPEQFVAAVRRLVDTVE